MKWWVSNFDITISIDVIAILFGIPNYSNDHVIHFMNICILYAKWFIYCCKQKETDVFFSKLHYPTKECITVRKSEMSNQQREKFWRKTFKLLWFILTCKGKEITFLILSTKTTFILKMRIRRDQCQQQHTLKIFLLLFYWKTLQPLVCIMHLMFVFHCTYVLCTAPQGDPEKCVF